MEYFVVDVELRKIIIPEGITHIGVKGDNETRTLNFKMPTTYKGLDLSEYEAKVHYENAVGEEGLALAENKVVDGENMMFQWKVEGDVYVKEGKMYFWIGLENKSSLSGLSLNKWHTTKASLEVLDGGCVSDEILNRNPSMVDQILIRLADVEAQAEANEAEKISEAFVTQRKEVILTEKTTLIVGKDVAVGDVISYSWESGADLTISIKKKSNDGLTTTESKWINGIYEGSDSLTVEEGYTSIVFPVGMTVKYPKYPRVIEVSEDDYLVIGTSSGVKKIRVGDFGGDSGEDGSDGVGIKSIAKTATNGLVDTYTITLTNDTTSTFNVTNGKNGADGKDGNDGENGYTPVKGTDYWTDEDKAEIIKDINLGSYVTKEEFDLFMIAIGLEINEIASLVGGIEDEQLTSD